MYGCESTILQLLKLPDGTVKVLVEGLKRVKIVDFKDDDKFITCSYEYNEEVIQQDEDLMLIEIWSSIVSNEHFKVYRIVNASSIDDNHPDKEAKFKRALTQRKDDDTKKARRKQKNSSKALPKDTS